MTALPDNRTYHPPEEFEARTALLDAVSALNSAAYELDHTDWDRLNESFKHVEDALTLVRKIRDIHLSDLMDALRPETDWGRCEAITEQEVRSGPLMGPAVVCGEPCEPETDYCAEHQPAYEPVEAYDMARDRALEAS